MIRNHLVQSSSLSSSIRSVFYRRPTPTTTSRMRLFSTLDSSSTTGFTYLLGGTGSSNNTLYVPLTSRCNARTLSMTRGPQFGLPPSVIAALCRVRDAEHDAMQWKHWCLWLDMQDDHYPPHKLPEYSYEFVSSITPLKNGQEDEDDDDVTSSNSISEKDATVKTTGRPTVDELMAEIISARSLREDIRSIVIGGEGEPLLRYKTLLELIERTKKHIMSHDSDSSSDSGTTIRLTTNGLVDPSQATRCTRELRDAGLDAVSVAFMTHDAQQYQDLMDPVSVPIHVPTNDNRDSSNAVKENEATQQQQQQQQQQPHDWMRQFCVAAVQAGLQVELTAIDRPDVDREATEKRAAELFVDQMEHKKEGQESSSVMRWRPYFP